MQYRTVYARQTRAGHQPLHIGRWDDDPSLPPRASRMDAKTLCATWAALYPQDGPTGQLARATCKHCIRVYRKLTGVDLTAQARPDGKKENPVTILTAEQQKAAVDSYARVLRLQLGLARNAAKKAWEEIRKLDELNEQMPAGEILFLDARMREQLRETARLISDLSDAIARAL
jgi:hypothetical protein